MKCFYCKGDLDNYFTTHFTELGNCIVSIKNVPCLKCRQCGEIVLTGTVVDKIDAILEKNVKNTIIDFAAEE